MNKFELAIFDMDGTLLKGRSIYIFAEQKGFYNDLERVIKSKKQFYKKSIEIAKSLRGMKCNELLKIFRKIPLQDNVDKLLFKLKEYNIKTAIATDSYQFLANDLMKRLDMDYAFGNNLMIDNGIITGNLVIDNIGLKNDSDGNNIYSIRKGHILDNLCVELGINPDEAIAIGDGIVDISMIKKAGLGIAYNAPEIVQQYADISVDNMMQIINLVKR